MGSLSPTVKDESLPLPDRMRLQFARGWLELGCVAEAEAELARVHPAHALAAESLELRFQVLAKSRRYHEALAVAQQQRDLFPAEIAGLMNMGNALFWLDRTDKAVALVEPAIKEHPSETVLPYNLACYLVKLGDTDAAKQWLRHAMKIGHAGRVVRHALIDADLEPVWPWLRSLAASKAPVT